MWNCAYHIIFCPKYRYKVLVSLIDSRIKDLVLEKLSTYGCEVLEQGLMPDHVHLLLVVSPILSVLQAVNTIKGWTSYSLRKEFSNLRSLPSLWSPSKFISSCGAVMLEVVNSYIEGQRI
ncbi:MAG: IS200/IS605 family transposase [Nitrospirae bacterium]|nr:MAG: IS200/IS605 family transposase [Nitrospirota bacterium]